MNANQLVSELASKARIMVHLSMDERKKAAPQKSWVEWREEWMHAYCAGKAKGYIAAARSVKEACREPETFSGALAKKGSV